MSLPKFTNPDLLETALTHRSALNEPESGSQSLVSNERMEFLGDAVLELVVTHFLFTQLPQEPEGKLTAYRSALVRTTTLAQVASELGLGDKLFMSKGEEATGGRQNPGLLANTMEAVIGAIYLDQGFISAQDFIEKNLLSKLEEIRAKRLYKDPKSLLQELVQSQGSRAPSYQVVKAEGPDHAKIFTIEVKVAGEVKGSGTGHSKQSAEQQAARDALSAFEKN